MTELEKSLERYAEFLDERSREHEAARSDLSAAPGDRSPSVELVEPQRHRSRPGAWVRIACASAAMVVVVVAALVVLSRDGAKQT